MKTTLPLLAAAAFCLTPVRARAETVRNETQDAPDELSATVVLSRLHAINQGEIHAGEMAKSRAASQETKEFGQRMITDHTQADQKVTELADTLSVTLSDPMKLSLPDEEQRDLKAERAQMHALGKLSGRSFDKQYFSMMATGHAKAIDLLTKTSMSAEDQQVRDLAKALLPTVESHKDAADKDLETFGGAQ